MRHGSIFSGIGGFDLAAEWMGWENVFHCEWNQFSQKILKKHWPNAISYGDITKTDFNVHRGSIDIFSGGFPCQPFSSAGKRKGSSDNRYLWPEMLRAIREIQPVWIVGENVSGLLNWSRGLVFKQVQSDLEAAGYESFPVVLPAISKNAVHIRERVWFIAHSINEISKERLSIRKAQKKPSSGNTNKNETRLFDFEWQESGIEPLVYRKDNGIPNWTHRITALGNAIVPQVAHEVFKAIDQYESSLCE